MSKTYNYFNNAIIKKSDNEYLVIKKEDSKIIELYTYLTNSSFYNIPNVINYTKDQITYEYVFQDYIINNQKYIEMIKIIALLHNKTQHYKEISKDIYKEIKDSLENNINYYKTYYESLFLKFMLNEYQSPSEYLFTRNYYKIKELLFFLEKECNQWYELVKNNNEQRVCVIHNNLSIDHFIYNKNKSILVSWNQYKIDTPILDIVKLYKNEYQNTEFNSILKTYFNLFELKDYEKKLLFILISMPFKVEINNTHNSIISIHNLIEYILKTESLIRPYYSK